METSYPSNPRQQPARTTALDPSLEDACRRFNETFNRHDGAQLAKHWTEDGSLITPAGERGDGRGGVQRVFEHDAGTILAGTTSRFRIQSARPLGADLCFLDLEHELQGCRMPDGSRGTAMLHVAILARREGGEWKWLDARPYAFARQEPLH